MVLPTVWGAPALMEFADPKMTVLVKGVSELLLPTTSCKPEGVDAKFNATVFGSRKTLVVPVRPRASVAVSLISRYE